MSWVSDFRTFLSNLQERQADSQGANVEGRPHTATYYVSPDGSSLDGSSWSKAFQTINEALDAASLDSNASTLIILAPHATGYDIDVTGDPTWACNISIRGTHRNWCAIKNDHGSASSVLKLTGRSSLQDLTIDCGSGSNNGLILTGDGVRVRLTYLEAEDVTGAQTALEISGSPEYARVESLTVHGVQAHTLALKLSGCTSGVFERLDLKECLTGIQWLSNSHANIFNFIILNTCTLGLDIDSGDGQFFSTVAFANCTTDVDDEVKNHGWSNMQGSFPVVVLPDNLIGVNVATGGVGAYGGDTELIAAGAIDGPFRLVAIHFEPDAAPAEWHQCRLSADSGSTFFDMMQFQGLKREGTEHPSGTEFIFNAGTRISCSIRNESGGGNVLVWLEVQVV